MQRNVFYQSCRQFSGDGGRRARGARNTKNFDWYQNAIERLSIKKEFEPIEMFPQALGPRVKAHLEFTCGETVLGQLVFDLCTDILPVTCKNFMLLCNGKQKYKYEGTIIHRIVKNSCIMGGDVESFDGKGGHAVLDLESKLGGRYFKDEAFVGLHNSYGILSMTNAGIDTNNSQFLITTKSQPQLNGRNVAFGYLTSGKDVLEKITSTFTFQQRPLTPVILSKCRIDMSNQVLNKNLIIN